MATEQETAREPAQLPMAPNEIRSVALAELDRLGDFVQNLSIDIWKKPSAVAGWSNGDVVAHLTVMLTWYRQVLGAIRTGWTSGGMWKTLGEWSKTVVPKTSSALHAVNNALPRFIDATLSPEVVRGQCSASVRKTRESLQGIGSADYTKPVYYMGGPLPMSFFLAAIVNETAMHRWDIESTLDPQAHLSLDACKVLPIWYWSGSSFMLQLPSGTTGSVQAVLEDPDFELWWTLDGKGIGHGIGRLDNPAVTITGTSSAFSLALGGRLKAEDAFRNTSLETSGDRELARRFLEAWKLI